MEPAEPVHIVKLLTIIAEAEEDKGLDARHKVEEAMCKARLLGIFYPN